MATTYQQPTIERTRPSRSPGRHRRNNRRSRRRRVLSGLFFGLAGLLAVGGVALSGPLGDLVANDGTSLAEPPPPPAAVEPTTDAAVPTSSPSSPPETASSSPPPPVLRLAGPVPFAGRGTFGYAAGKGKVLGEAGTLRRYRVAVEDGADEDVEEFAEAVDLVLADERSWIGSGRLRLQRVPNGGGHDFTIYLATPKTAQKMCAAGWVDIRINGKPYTSCRTQGKVIINLDRWRRSVDDYVAAEVPLATYREYVINHEVGHELGHGHERCPGRGRPAPTMQTQTLGLKGCLANPWPYLNGARYAGSRV
ncbi:MAG TPA: DUF3152 domain-containing protein [Micromonosporaceae bacterium]|nr:DUF3152 domain-containing protein [Micromonosporaceae bacterium]